MKRACELCAKMARIRCEADDASLCWDCDAAVHSANFLVARHSRNLLCHLCQSPTQWSASGAKVGPAVSFCLKCADSRIRDGGDEEDPAAEVPWSPPPPSPSPETSSSNKESDGGGGRAVDSRKRCRIALGILESPAKRVHRNEAGSGTEAAEVHAFDLNTTPSAVDADLFSHQQI